MSRSALFRTPLAVFVILLIATAVVLYREVGRTISDNPSVWEREISAFERMDQASPPPRDVVLFVGSSSIRLWEGLAADMAPLSVIRRGFGGAKISDLLHFSDRLLLPYVSYSPRVIVIHAGGNEMNRLPGNRVLSAEEVRADLRRLIAILRTHFGETPIYYLALRPSGRLSARDEFLRFVQADFGGDPSLHYLDGGAALAMADGSANPDLIGWDSIHLNRKGYEAWARPVRERLHRDLIAAQ